MGVDGLLPLDANGNPIQTDGVVAKKSHTLVGSNETAVVPLFRITGNIEVKALYGVVRTILGSNNTAADFRLNDQTSQIVLTAAAGTTLSSAPAGSIIARKALAATALTLKSAAAGVEEAASAGQGFFSPVLLTKKATANTDIEFVYTTTQEPTSGVIEFFLRYLPLSADAKVTPL